MLEDTATLLGLFTVVIAFLSSMYARPITGGIKTFLPMMHRNDFATMFALLPPSQRELLRENETHFVQAVLAGLFGDPDLGIEDLDLAAHANQPVVKSLALGSGERRAFHRRSRTPHSDQSRPPRCSHPLLPAAAAEHDNRAVGQSVDV